MLFACTHTNLHSLKTTRTAVLLMKRSSIIHCWNCTSEPKSLEYFYYHGTKCENRGYNLQGPLTSFLTSRWSNLFFALWFQYLEVMLEQLHLCFSVGWQLWKVLGSLQTLPAAGLEKLCWVPGTLCTTIPETCLSLCVGACQCLLKCPFCLSNTHASLLSTCCLTFFWVPVVSFFFYWVLCLVQ